MPKELVISTSPHETRVAILEGGHLCEIYVEREKEYALVGSIYKGRVTRVLPGMQSAFVDIGLDTDAFLYVSDVLEEELSEYDNIVSTVEEKAQKMEEQGAQLFGRPGESASGAVEPIEVLGEAEAQPPIPAPVIRPPSDAPAGPQGLSQGPRQEHGSGYHRESGRDAGRRGGRRRRRGGRGGPRDDGRELPRSKYVSNAPAGSRTENHVASQQSYRPPGGESFRRETPSYAPPVDLEPIILPGESLAKYKNLAPKIEASAPVMPTTEASAESLESAAAAPPTLPWHTETVAETPAAEVASGSPMASPIVESETAEFNEEIAQEEAEEIESSEERTEESPIASLSGPAGEARGAQIAVPGKGISQAAEPPTSGTPAKEEHLSELEAATLLEAAAEDAEAAALAEDEETRMAESIPELDEEGETDRQIREDIFEAAGEGGAAPLERIAENGELAAEAAHDQATQPQDERTARVRDDQRQRFQRPQRQGGPRPGRGGHPQHGRSHGRHEAQRRGQSISDLLKAGQEIIIQIAKEPLGKKGARITSHVALPGRFLVYMPTLEHTGVSRKISSPEQRSRLRHLVSQYNTTFPGGFIVRTAAETASDDEVRADIEYLGRTWQEIRGRADQRHAPALLHRDLNLVERILRDYFSPDFTSIWVDNQEEYARVLDFISRFQPDLINRVKLYTKDAPIFEEFGIQQEIDKALRPKVWLKSGGYIVINHTEALVAIDVNTGKFVGRGSTRLEDTIVKTNIEAVKEIVRQIRLRDLGGIIVVDFIDMEERKNRMKVMQALEEALRDDRAPSKVLFFNEFGLVNITRKRTKQALERVLCQPCPYCTGSGMVKSIHTICYEAQAEARKMAAEIDAQSVTLRVHPEIAKALKTRESALIDELEQWTKKSVIIQGDPSLHWEQFDIY
jgi:ribonuclease G